jgi:transposase
MTIKILGIDLGKKNFHVCGVDARGRQVARNQYSRKGLLAYLSNLPPCLIGFEACAGAHYWARKAKALGHTAKLMPAQFVKPYVKSNKNDYLDAEAICEAVQRPNMRFVTSRTPEQQALGSVVRLRDSLVRQRNAVINQVHGFLLEFGIEYPKGRSTVTRLPRLLSEWQDELPVLMQSSLYQLYDEYVFLTQQIQRAEKLMSQHISQDERGKRLLAIPGVGLITASSLIAWVGDAKQFTSGRALAAWIGLVPKQHSTGGKPTLLGIGKRSHSRLRTNLIHGARSALQWHIDTPSRWNAWAKKMLQEKPKSLTVVALANKLARMIWVVLAKNESYEAMAA